MRVLLLTMLALLTLAPLAAAQETNETKPERPDDAAWVEDCPPDMMCAAGSEERPEDEPTYDGDCGAEVCAYGDEGCIECSGPSDGGAEPGQALGPDDCIDCMQAPTRGPSDGSCENCRGDAPTSDGSTCMDGADPHEICDREVQYLDGGNGEPTTGGELAVEDDATKSVPGASFIVVVAAFALAIFLLARRR